MAVKPGKPYTSLIILLSIILVTSATITTDHSDHNAFSFIHKDLGLRGQHSLSTTPCNNPGVFCERRLSRNNSYVLRITRLIFKSRRLDGFLSPAIGRLAELKELSVPNNQLVDQIPSQILNCKKLEILDLGNNKFSGQVPSELSKLVRLRVLDLANNKFFGNLTFLKQFPNLEQLNLANNLFSGTIPKSIRSFRNLQFFDFSGNDFLERHVPVMSKAELSRYPKRYIFAESGNRTRTTAGRNGSSAAGPTSAQAPGPSKPVDHKKKDNKKKLSGWILGFLAGAVAGTLSGLVFSLMFRLAMAAIRGGGRDSGLAIFSPHLIKKAENLAFLEKEDGLANLEVIGRGGCGEVYKAELPGSNGKIVAIKKISEPSRDAAELSEEDSRSLNKKMRQIRSEIKTVGEIRHRNLLPLLAHLPRPNCHYLVYEFMKNGSLHDILYQVEQGNRVLDWPARHKIALGVASGLEYLHTNHSPRIIHRDLKPANILIDDDMEARIADFGLAKAMPDAHTHVTTSNVAGTIGYIAPEYHQTLKFTDKCDIYSFGVILGVLVMGKLPSDEFFQTTREMSLVKWMRNIITSENPIQAIDRKLMGNGFEEQMLLVLKIACFCTLDDPKQRPNSKDIRIMLSQIKH